MSSPIARLEAVIDNIGVHIFSALTLKGWCEMVPVVLIDGKPIILDRIIEVRTDRDLNQPDPN